MWTLECRTQFSRPLSLGAVVNNRIRRKATNNLRRYDDPTLGSQKTSLAKKGRILFFTVWLSRGPQTQGNNLYRTLTLRTKHQ